MSPTTIFYWPDAAREHGVDGEGGEGVYPGSGDGVGTGRGYTGTQALPVPGPVFSCI